MTDKFVDKFDIQDKTSAAEIIDKWFAHHFDNSRYSQDTDTYNFLLKAKADLKKRLS